MGKVLDGNIKVLELVVHELTHDGSEERNTWMRGRKTLHFLQLTSINFSLVGEQPSENEHLLIIVLSYDRLYGFCTRHSGFFAHKSGRSTETEASDFCNPGENGWSDSVLVLQFVHDSEMLLLLVPHVLRKDVIRSVY